MISECTYAVFAGNGIVSASEYQKNARIGVAALKKAGINGSASGFDESKKERIPAVDGWHGGKYTMLFVSKTGNTFEVEESNLTRAKEFGALIVKHNPEIADFKVVSTSDRAKVLFPKKD